MKNGVEEGGKYENTSPDVKLKKKKLNSIIKKYVFDKNYNALF